MPKSSTFKTKLSGVSPFRKAQIIFFLIICLLAITGGASYAIFTSVTADLPEIKALKNYKPPVGTQIFSEDDHLIGRLKVDKGIFVPLSQIPLSLRRAVVAVEDARFYEHGGLDLQGILRAMLKDAISVSFKEGGSTITQQLAKVMFLTPEKSLTRKLKEALLARKIEQNLSKDEILELYLNKVYFGHGAYGVEMAARTYFGKHVGDLTLGECAMVAGLIRSPMGYSPYMNMERARQRERVVLKRMVDEKYISQGRCDTAYAQPLTLKNLRATEEVAPHLVELIRQYLEKKYGMDKVYIEGLNVRTTINYRLQKYADQAVEDGVRMHDKRQGFRGPLGKRTKKEMEKLLDNPPSRENTFRPGEILTGTVLAADDKGASISSRGVRGYISLADMKWAAGRTAADQKKKAWQILSPGWIVEVRYKNFDKRARRANFSLEQEPTCQAALVAIDPWEGKVRAMVGGPDFQKNEYNHAMYASRQPGSAFKPFVYAEAFESGFTPATIIDDTPRSYDNDRWKPRNYDGEYYGPTRLREALVYSRNVVTIELLNQVGVEKVIDLARKLGMSGPFARNLTLALGSCGATPMELTTAYCAFANGGYSVKPVMITRVTDRRGRVLESNETHVEQVMTPETAYQVTSILEDVCRRGTAASASCLGRIVAGKTGTTNDYRDAWFVGYIPGLVAGVWVGNDNQKPLGHGESGARAALPIWMRFMGPAMNVCPPDDFPVPDGLELVDIDARTGLLPTGQSTEVQAEFFKKGTAPTEYSAPPAPEPPGAVVPVIDEKKKQLQQSVD